MKRILIGCAVFFWVVTVGMVAVFPDGLLLVEPQHGKSSGPVPISVEYHRVRVEIKGGIAVTRVDQVFKNNFNTDLEGTYLFPIPETAAISDFSLYINGRRTSGEILTGPEARRVYEDIVRRMKDPGLLEYAGRNMFRARVYPVPARGKRRVELEYSQPLDYDAGIYRYVYPLDTEKYSPSPLEEVSISAHIESNIPIKSVYSPSHDIDVSLKQYIADAGFEQRNVRPDRDFTLYYTVSRNDVGMNILTYREAGQPGFFSLLLSPGVLERSGARKDIVFVVDTSGSMRGEKIDQVKEALEYCIENLNRGDRFNVVQFATVARTFAPSLAAADRTTIQKARSFIDELDARGGTNIYEALQVSMRMFSDTERPKMIVFLTDGEPTVGKTDIGVIARDLLTANRSQVRLFVFGVGDDVNTHLLDNIAEQNSGFADYFRPGEDITSGVTTFYRKVSEPVLSDISLDFSGIDVRDIYPVVLQDIFNGSQLVLFGRFDGAGSSAIVLTGELEGIQKRFVFEGRFPEAEETNDFIPGLWAVRKIGYLMNEIRLNGEKKELVDEIVLLSKEYGILTPYTSYLILENVKDYERWGISETAAPEMRSKGKAYKGTMEKEVGAESVQRSLDIMAMKKRSIEPAAQMKSVKRVAGKTFYFRVGAWVDADYSETMRVTTVKLFSEQYFDLLRRNPEIGKYFAIGRSVTVVFGSRCYRIHE
jgi:Ca-activated chloride channel family protein